MEHTVTLRNGKKPTVSIDQEDERPASPTLPIQPRSRRRDRGDKGDGTDSSALDDLIASIEANYELYGKQLKHVRDCKELLAKAAQDGEFSAEELLELQQGVKRQIDSAQPLVKQLAAQIQIAQKDWRRKQTAIESVSMMLDADQMARWTARHEQRADRIDALVNKLK